MTIARIQRLTIPAELSWHYDLMFVAMCLVIATTGEGQRVGSAPRLQAALQT